MPVAALLVAGQLVVACGEFVENIPPRPAASDDPAIGETPYPSLASVPARPQLTYTLEQRREIAQGLVADRANARYAGDTVRRDLDRPVQPDTAPPLPPLPETASPPAADPEADLALAYIEDALARDSDDGSLGDFLERLEQRPPASAEAGPTGPEPAQAPTEPPTEPPAEAEVEPAPVETESPSSLPEPATSPSARAEAEAEARDAEAVPPEPAIEPAVAAVDLAADEASPAGEAFRRSDDRVTADAAAPRASSAAAPPLPVEVLFEPGAVDLAGEPEQEMHELARDLQAETFDIVVSGGGERVGLAMERARRVAALLVGAGVPPARIAIEVGGERDVVVVYRAGA